MWPHHADLMNNKLPISEALRAPTLSSAWKTQTGVFPLPSSTDVLSSAPNGIRERVRVKALPGAHKNHVIPLKAKSVPRTVGISRMTKTRTVATKKQFAPQSVGCVLLFNLLLWIMGNLLGSLDGLWFRAAILQKGNDSEAYFFRDGLGDLELAADFERILHNIESGAAPLPPIEKMKWIQTIDAKDEAAMPKGAAVIETAFFETQFHRFLPEESRFAYIEIVRPAGVPKSKIRRVAVHTQMTGDESFEFRRNQLAIPLLKQDVASILLITPLYGVRRPADQQRHYVRTVSLFFRAVFSSIVEGAALVEWSRLQFPSASLAVTGISYGGGSAACAGALCGGPVAIISCVGPSSASALLHGSLASSVSWSSIQQSILSQDYVNDRNITDIQKYMHDMFQNMGNIWRYTENASRENRHNGKVFLSISAKHDSCVAPENSRQLNEAMSSLLGEERCEQKWLPCGHVVAIATAQCSFIPPIVEAFEKLEGLGTPNS